MNEDLQTDITGGKMAAFDELMQLRRDGPPGRDEVQISGSDPFYRTPFKVGETVAAVLAGIGVVANDIGRPAPGSAKRCRSTSAMAAATIRTGDYTRAQDASGAFHHVPTTTAFAHMLTVTQPWRTKDGRYALPHLNLPHLSARVSSGWVARARRTPSALPSQIGIRTIWRRQLPIARACGGKVRTKVEWLAHPQGRFLASCLVVGIQSTAPGKPKTFHLGDRPLSGVRVLDLTRILAGPLAGRSLAEQGVDVVPMVTAEQLPQTAGHVRDTGHGNEAALSSSRPRRAGGCWRL